MHYHINTCKNFKCFYFLVKPFHDYILHPYGMILFKCSIKKHGIYRVCTRE